MRAVIFLIVLGCLGVLFVQNQEPVSLVFFGFYKTTPLPVAVWLLSFLGAGLLTSVAWQILSNLSPQKIPRKSNRSETSPKTSKVKENAWSRNQERKVKEQDPNAKAQQDDDWDIEEPAKESTNTSPENYADDEAPLQPKTTYRSGSVYSYSYRDTENRKQGATDQIYEANYRVIKPPLKENTKANEEQEEDWI